ncbi:L,D-transpeptidase family protein [Paracoccus sp. TK19116]|uniref:L,D-transpeptidase family protein n=1 Tax=Paracoccus albicereus TaxID=2922394 RepID=A0ABT1MNW3_9RHOB|nr:L,D-transpeptidase family protein [Paracoccus albicereus]MCQ0969980.1 L,D-transpeptidase family protein [Paracoccus albicereus]
MNRRQLLTSGAGALILGAIAGCAPSKFKSYDGPPVTQIVVNKGARQMFLLSGPTVLKSYRFGLGWAPVGDKFFEGDGRTPEGNYFIDRRNPNSEYHLSIGISYPTPQEVAEAALVGRSAGSDIFIHGRGPEGNRKVGSNWDWTAGCITVSDKEMEDIYAMVRDGTPIQINP